MTRLDTSTTSSSFASGNLTTSASAFNSHTSLPWIIDSGASDHMTGSSPVFCAYTPCSGRDKVRNADGTVSSVSGKGLVRVTPLLSLSSVLHVPNFTTNLLSIGRITRDKNCSVTFFLSHCVFQDLITGRTIGNGREENGLYLLESQDQQQMAHHTTHTSSTTGDIMLWHRRLGHPSFSLLKHLFPSLSSNKIYPSFAVKIVNLESTTVLLFILVIIKALFLFLLYIQMFGVLLVLLLLKVIGGLSHL
ncbi:Endonuclease [Actinidia chinensis var. chinensis]|uniref:Endonuclease n=1 Tax=Actinidia chinensis var. chinensis TaxID=1590841 RepID=A0A2R6S0F8_ACTCC|nr:Endonuclease [Actinidia chinensis var. chinensis]